MPIVNDSNLAIRFAHRDYEVHYVRRIVGVRIVGPVQVTQSAHARIVASMLGFGDKCLANEVWHEECRAADSAVLEGGSHRGVQVLL